MRGLLLGTVAWGLVATASAAWSYSEHPEPPLYPVVIVPTDDSLSNDTELAAFRRAVAVASRALVKTEQGEVYDPRAMLPYLAEEVEMFVGQGRDASSETFVPLGRMAALVALEIVGRLSRPGESDDKIVNRRYGMQAIERMLWDPTVGRTPWLGGRICTSSYAPVEFTDWIRVREKLDLPKQDWVIAADGGGEGEAWPARYQLVPVSPMQKRSGGWLGLTHPDGWTRFFHVFFGESALHFAPALNSHACFEKRDGGWKITALAERLD